MPPLNVLSLNIQEGGCDRLHSIASVVRAQDADFVALLEADSRDNAHSLADQLGMTLTYGEANCPSAIAWLSHSPPLRSHNHRTPALAKTLLELEVLWDGLPLHLFATHLGSRWNVQRPQDEVLTILETMHRVAENPHILVGDLNALRPGDPVGIPPLGEAKRGDAVDGAPRLAIRRLVEAGYVDCYRQLHPDTAGFTYPSQDPWLRLDYVFASPALAIRLDSSGIVDTPAARRASDHLGVWATFTPAMGRHALDAYGREPGRVDRSWPWRR